MKKSYRTGYTPDDIAKAYAAVKDRGLPIRSAAIMFGVPPQTLRDRFTGVVDPDSLPGADPLLSKDEETVLVEHVEVMAQMGMDILISNYSTLQVNLLIVWREDPPVKHLAIIGCMDF